MYQINIPGIYKELTDKNMISMQKVLYLGTAGASTLYIIAGIFGLVAFAACNTVTGYPLNKNKDPPVPWTFEDIFDE